MFSAHLQVRRLAMNVTSLLGNDAAYQVSTRADGYTNVLSLSIFYGYVDGMAF